MTRHFAAVGASLAVLFAAVPATPQVADTELAKTQIVLTEKAAERWHLSIDEWSQYQTLMEGPRGIWSPALDPITVLGIHAETDAERRRYAELLVTIEFERVQNELLFQHAYSDAAQRLFPNLPRVEQAASVVAASPLLKVSSFDVAERVAFIGSVSAEKCPSCQADFARFLARRAAAAEHVLDVFLADAADGEAIRLWARRAGVDPADVREGRITLNHARAPFVLSTTDAAVGPRVLERRAGRWVSREVVW
jgi:integrating conjugative element protein (TIGR03759 family)